MPALRSSGTNRGTCPLRPLRRATSTIRCVFVSPPSPSGTSSSRPSESKGGTSSSVIDRKAMEHIQPSSFADLLALLPGGSSSSPVLSAPNTIHLREIGISNDDYATSSLGTSFVIDGAPMRNDANMQYLPGGDQLLERKLFINKGVDMRSISTDEIQHVEIVRGIPSVEYGDLTSGLVKIERKRGGKALTARFKADMDSKLFSVGKGFEIPDRGLTVNIGADLLDSKADPRNKLENYKRMTGRCASIKPGTPRRIAPSHWVRTSTIPGRSTTGKSTRRATTAISTTSNPNTTASR